MATPLSTILQAGAIDPPRATARYLWLGFGTLIGLLLVTCLLIISRVGTIDAEVREMADARNFSAATAQLESDTLRYVISIRDFLDTGDPLKLKTAETAANAVRQHLHDYQRLAVSDRRYDLAGEFEPLWSELLSRGQELAATPAAARPMLAPGFVTSRFRLQKMLASDMQADALDVYNQRKDEALADIKTVIHFAIFLLMAGILLALATSFAIARGIVRAERRLADGSELLRVTLESIADAVLTTDRYGIITYLNRQGESLTGWSSHEATGQPLDEVLHLVDGPSRNPIESSVTSVLRDAAVTQLASHPTLISRSRAECAVEERASAIRDESGMIVGTVLIVRDVTERHRLEQELRIQAAALAETDRRKTEFLSMLSHEMRNPLAPISNALQILRKRIEEAPGLRPTVAILERQVTQMVRLVDDLIDISRINRGKIDLRRGPTHLVSVLQLAVDGARPMLDGHELELIVTLPAEAVVMHADSARLAQIVGNLLGNAAKFTDRHGSIHLKAEVDADSVIISVSDSGIGISPQHLPHVFDLYMQFDNSLGRSSSGIGLGLALVKELVELHGGTVSASSPGLGMGSTFVVRLPLHRPISSARCDETGAAPSDLDACNVLVVDDNQDALASLVSLLEADGHRVLAAPDGKKALQLAREVHPNVIILDLGMPHVDGFHVAQQIRSAPWGASVALIAVTGFGQPEDKSRTLLAGFDEHLVKPATYSQIREAMIAAIASRISSPAAAET